LIPSIIQKNKIQAAESKRLYFFGIMSELTIRNMLHSGDLGQIDALHGQIYAEEHGFGLGFEAYVMESLVEFWTI
jgi:hypothetical protein